MNDQPRPSLSDCSPQVLDKARNMVLAEAVTVAGSEALHGMTGTKHLYRVTGSRGDAYKVSVTDDADGPRWVTCTCPHGMNSVHYERTGCSHIAAVLMYREVMPR